MKEDATTKPSYNRIVSKSDSISSLEGLMKAETNEKKGSQIIRFSSLTEVMNFLFIQNLTNILENVLAKQCATIRLFVQLVLGRYRFCSLVQLV